MFEICVFTAGEKDYADIVLNFIDPDKSIIKNRLYRHHCIKSDKGVFVKDLGIIKDRSLTDMIIVDNSIISFAFNMENGVPIKSFMGEPNDEELLFLVTFLEEIYSHDDVRPHIKNTFKLIKLMEMYANKDKLKKSRTDETKLLQNAQASLHGK